MNYKTLAGLLKAIDHAAAQPRTVRLAWWLESAQYALIHKWGYTEQNAATTIYKIKAKHPPNPAYRANS